MSEHISAVQLDRYADAATAQLRAERDDARRQMQSLTEDYVAMEARAVKAEATVREQAEQLDIQTALATNYAGKAVEYKQEKERAEEQLDTLRKQYEWCAGLLGTHDHTGSDHMEDAAREAERAERAEAQLDTLRNAIGDTDEVRILSTGWGSASPFALERWGRIADALDALAAAGGGVPQEGAQFVEVDYWCHFDDKGRATRVHDASTVHMDGCTRMYVRVPEEGATDE